MGLSRLQRFLLWFLVVADVAWIGITFVLMTMGISNLFLGMVACVLLVGCGGNTLRVLCRKTRPPATTARYLRRGVWFFVAGVTLWWVALLL